VLLAEGEGIFKIFPMSLQQEKYYTAEVYYNLSDDIRAELIYGQIVCMDPMMAKNRELIS
jgi:hypothetical protein